MNMMISIDRKFAQRKLSDLVVLQLLLFELVATIRDEFQINPEILSQSSTLQFVTRIMEMNIGNFEDIVQGKIPTPTAADIIGLNMKISSVIKETNDLNSVTIVVNEFVENFMKRNYKETVNDFFSLDSFSGNGTIQ